MPGMPLPLCPGIMLFTRDDPLAVAVRRLAEAAGIEVGVRDGPPEGRQPGCRLHLIGLDLADRVPGEMGARGGEPPSDLVVVALTPPSEAAWPAAIRLAAGHVAVLPGSEDWLLTRLADASEPQGPGALVIGTVGGRGGAGASVLALALARTAAEMRHRCLLIDLDPRGPGLDLLAGPEPPSGLRWQDLSRTRGRIRPRALLEGLPVVDGVHLLGWEPDRPAEATRVVVEAVVSAVRHGTDLVVLDLPRALDDAAATALRACGPVLLVVPAEVRAVASARRMRSQLSRHVADLRLVVRGPAPTGLPAEAMVDALELPLAGDLRAEPGLGAALDRGEPPGLHRRGPLSAFSRHLLGQEMHWHRAVDGTQQPNDWWDAP